MDLTENDNKYSHTYSKISFTIRFTIRHKNKLLQLLNNIFVVCTLVSFVSSKGENCNKLSASWDQRRTSSSLTRSRRDLVPASNCWSQVSLLTKFCHLVEKPFFELPHFFDFWEGVFLSYNDSCTINSQFWFIFSWHRASVVCHKLEPQPTQFFLSVPFTFYSKYYPMITELLCNHGYYLTLLLDQFSVWTHITYAHNTRRDKNYQNWIYFSKPELDLNRFKIR